MTQIVDSVPLAADICEIDAQKKNQCRALNVLISNFRNIIYNYFLESHFQQIRLFDLNQGAMT